MRFCIAIAITALLAACNSDDKAAPKRVDVATRENALNKTLEQGRMHYQPGQTISTLNYHLDPCSETLTLQLAVATEEMRVFVEDLKKENRLEEAARYEKDLNERFIYLRDQLNTFCLKEKPLIQTCLRDDAKVYVVLHDVETPAINVLFVPISTKDLSSNIVEYAFYRELAGQVDFTQLYDDGRNYVNGLENFAIRDRYNSERDNFKKAFLCIEDFDMVILESEISIQIKKYLHTASEQLF